MTTPVGTFSGTLNDTVLSWSGQYETAAKTWMTITSMSLEVSGNGFSGTSQWDSRDTIDGPIVCSGSTQITASRISNSSPPLAPSNLSATATSESSIALTWLNNATDEQGFKMERSVAEFDGYSEVGTSNAGITNYIDTGLVASTNYYYRIRAFNDAGLSEYSPISFATTNSQSVSVPSAPSNLQITANSTTSITLTWDDVSGEVTYKIERSDSEFSGYNQIATTVANVTTLNDTGLLEGTTYYYRVIATNSAGDSAESVPSMVTTGISSVEVPLAPSLLNVTTKLSTSISLNWTGVENESGYKVERSIDDITFNQIDTVGVNVSSYTDTGLSASTEYYYRIRAYNSGGYSEYSNTISVTTDSPPLSAPAVPTNLVATATSSTSVVLTWNDVDFETGYKIQRSIFSNATGNAITLSENLTTYTFTGLTSDTTYYFKMQALNTAGYSTNSVTVNAKTSTEVQPKILRIINDLDDRNLFGFNWGIWNQIVRVRIASNESLVLANGNTYERLAPKGNRVSSVTQYETIRPGYQNAVEEGVANPSYYMDFDVSNLPDDYSMYIAAGTWNHVTVYSPNYWEKQLVTVLECDGVSPALKWATFNIIDHVNGIINIQAHKILPDWGWNNTDFC